MNWLRWIDSSNFGLRYATTGIATISLLIAAASCGGGETQPDLGLSAAQSAVGEASAAPTNHSPALEPDSPHRDAGTLASPDSIPTPPLVRLPKADRLAAELLREAMVRRDRGKEASDSHSTLALQLMGKKHAARKLIAATYKLTGDHLVFSADGAPLPAAERLIEAVRELPSHGVSLKPYPLEKAEAALTKVAALEKPRNSEAAARVQRMMAWLDRVDAKSSPDVIAAELLEAGFTDDDINLLSEARVWRKEAQEASVSYLQDFVALDVALLECFYRYALDFKHIKIAHPFRAMREPESGWSAFHDRLIDDFKSVPLHDLKTHLESWWPRNPQYAQLRQSLALYEKLSAEAAQPTVPGGNYKKGHYGNAISTIQRRLAQEGYYTGPEDAQFSNALDSAVRLYQQTHQLDVDGIVGGNTTKSINVPYSRRAEQVRLGLQRWRESEARWESTDHFRVNIPQFQVELWNGQSGEVIRRHNVVVGSNAWETDPERGIQGNLNRTMIFSDEMEMVVLNPLWHVPRRIIDTELAKAAEKDPDYYAKHNYTVQVGEDGSPKIYQGSGPGNALGLVKFLFPNEFSIYMHDTPKKKLFERTIRAFSHGCIRVHDPLDLARYLLVEREQRFTDAEFDAALKTGKERGIKLSRPIPVHIDYNTVGVHESGHVQFFLDIYQYDAAYWDGRVPFPRRNFKALDG